MAIFILLTSLDRLFNWQHLSATIAKRPASSLAYHLRTCMIIMTVVMVDHIPLIPARIDINFSSGESKTLRGAGTLERC